MQHEQKKTKKNPCQRERQTGIYRFLSKPSDGAFQKQALQNLNFCSLRTFLALRRLEAHALVFFESLEALALNFGEVGEKVFAARVGRNETKAFFRIKPLNDTGFHAVFPKMMTQTLTAGECRINRRRTR
jgi:hypothetical protein